MWNPFGMELSQHELVRMAGELEACNRTTERYGLSLSSEQIENLLRQRSLALKNTGRIEFGEGILKKLIFAFCDSPYITPKDYEDTLAELQEIFYYFKNEASEQLADDELIDGMESIFNGKAYGSLEYLAGTGLEELCRGKRFGMQEAVDDVLPEEDI